jgi:hypothetical protein
MAAMEKRQNTLDGKMSEVIASNAATTEALQQLTSMFGKYIVKMKDSKEDSPSVSKSALEN